MAIVVSVKVFSVLRDLVGSGAVSLSFEDPCVTVSDVVDRLAVQYGAETRREIVRDGKLVKMVLVNGTRAGLDMRVSDGDEIVIVPVIAGG